MVAKDRQQLGSPVLSKMMLHVCVSYSIMYTKETSAGGVNSFVASKIQPLTYHTEGTETKES